MKETKSLPPWNLSLLGVTSWPFVPKTQRFHHPRLTGLLIDPMLCIPSARTYVLILCNLAIVSIVCKYSCTYKSVSCFHQVCQRQKIRKTGLPFIWCPVSVQAIHLIDKGIWQRRKVQTNALLPALFSSSQTALGKSISEPVRSSENGQDDKLYCSMMLS